MQEKENKEQNDQKQNIQGQNNNIVNKVEGNHKEKNEMYSKMIVYGFLTIIKNYVKI